jgi:formate dehydrogenase assembly factor FdhD
MGGRKAQAKEIFERWTVCGVCRQATLSNAQKTTPVPEKSPFQKRALHALHKRLTVKQVARSWPSSRLRLRNIDRL